MRIRFLSDQTYETQGPGKGPSFKKGDVLDRGEVAGKLGLTRAPTEEWLDGFMNRWLQRGVAVDHDAVPQDPESGDNQVEKTDLTKLTRAELDERAVKRGIDISAAKTKAEVIAALEAAEPK